MYKSSLFVVLLVLSSSYSARLTAQTTGNRTQAPINIKNPQDPTRSAPTMSPAPGERNAEANRLYLGGIELAEVEQFSQAAEAFQQAIRLDPEFADAYSALGRAYFGMHQWQKAIDNLHRAVELRKRDRTQELAMQKRVESGIPAKANSVDSQSKLPQATAANGVSVKTPQPPPPRERQQVASTSTKAPLTKPESKPPATKANDTAVKPLPPKSVATPPPEQRQAGIPTKSSVTNAEIKQPANNSNIPAVKTLLESPGPAGIPTKAPLNNPQTKQPVSNANAPAGNTLQQLSETTQVQQQAAGVVPPLKSDDRSALEQTADPDGMRASMKLAPVSQPLETKTVPLISTKAANDESSLIKVYRVGPNDILDVRLNNSQSAKSTLFTVTPSGLLEYPMLDEPLPVAGFTVEEIGTKLEDELRTRALIEHPEVMVGVRDYVSHTILVSGLVKDSGTKFLRREAIPLYVVVADAQPLPEAAKVTLVRNEQHEIYDIDLTQVADLNLLVRPGDVITLLPNVTQFIYVGGEVKNPGEKTFRRGLTLTQALIIAGGVAPKCKVAQIGREDGRGFLVETRFDLKDIASGKASDPLLRPGDRIMIVR